MQKGVVLDTEDIKKILAEYFGVDPTNIIKSQYSYTVIGADRPKRSGTE